MAVRLVYAVARSITFGGLAGLVIGLLISRYYGKKGYTEEQIAKSKRLREQLSRLLKVATFTLLMVGLVWCGCFLLVAILDPAQAEYATNMAQLLVSFLTVISILFAFFEFLRR